MKKDFFIISRGKKRSGLRAQAIVEFAIALPVMLMLLVGMMEVGRMIFMYALVVNASRDAVRYASAYGRSDVTAGAYKYEDCAGIQLAANQSAYIVPLTSITISYDSGPASSGGVSLGSCGSPTRKIDTNDLVTVELTADYSPIVKLLTISPRTITSKSSRTIMGIYDLK